MIELTLVVAGISMSSNNIQATTWRKSVVQSGLLLEQPDANSTSQPARQCGVSLLYLVGFMNSIKGPMKDSKEVRGLRSESTAAAMHRYVFPCRFGRWMDYCCFLIALCMMMLRSRVCAELAST